MKAEFIGKGRILVEAEETTIWYKVTVPEYTRHRTKEGHLDREFKQATCICLSPEDMVTDHGHYCWWQEGRIQEQFS